MERNVKVTKLAPNPTMLEAVQAQGQVDQVIVGGSDPSRIPETFDNRGVFDTVIVDGVPVKMGAAHQNRAEFNQMVREMRDASGNPEGRLSFEPFKEAEKRWGAGQSSGIPLATGQRIQSAPTSELRESGAPGKPATAGPVLHIPEVVQPAVLPVVTDGVQELAPVASLKDAVSAVTSPAVKVAAAVTEDPRSLREMVVPPQVAAAVPLPANSQVATESLVPTIAIRFEIEGSVTDGNAFFHKVLREGSSLVLVFNTRAEGYPCNFPRVTDKEILVHIRGSKVIYSTRATAIRFTFLGYELCVMLILDTYPFPAGS